MIHPEHVSAILGHLRVVSTTIESSEKRGVYMFDPFCGDGSNAEQIAAVLGVDGVYGLEANKDLGATAKSVLGKQVLSPCTPENTLITGKSFGLAFVVAPGGT